MNTTHWLSLSDGSPEVRSNAAIQLARAWLSDELELPTRQVFAEIARLDAVHPGIADAFFETLHYDFQDTPDFDWADVKAWVLRVLQARRDRRAPLSAVPGNDLEFHAHELFDSDVPALEALLSWGYADVVALALDHTDGLPREQAVALMTVLFLQHGRREFGTSLATYHGVILPEAMNGLPSVALGGELAHRLSLQYAFKSGWHVHWLFPKPPSTGLVLGEHRDMLDELERAGVPLAAAEARLDPAKIRHIPFPDVPGARRQTLYPRTDVVIDLLVLENEQVGALRVVQVRSHDNPLVR